MIPKSLTRQIFRSTGSHRCFSSPQSNEITPEEIKKSAELVQRHKNFRKTTITPKTLTDAIKGLENSLAPLPENPAEIAALSGVPAEHQNRTVLIQPRPLKTLQAGLRTSHQWQITWQVSDRWTNPLMGWTSTADPHGALRLLFDSAEEAAAYATKHGWKYEVTASHKVQITQPGTVSYGDNFLPKKVIQQVKLDGPKNKVFENPKYGSSQWFMPLKYHGNGEVEQFGPKSSK